MKIKYCPTCDRNLSVDNFNYCRSRKDGYEYQCRECKCIRNKQYYIDNRVMILERNKGYYNRNKEKWVIYNSESYNGYERDIKNQGDIERDYHEWYNSEDGIRSRGLKQRRAHNESLMRRARLNNVSHNFTYDEWLDRVEMTNGICPICNKFVGKENMTLDHIIPISKVESGYIYTIDDVQPLCKSCNCSKGAKIL